MPLPSTQVRATGPSFQSFTHAGLMQLLLGPSMWVNTGRKVLLPIASGGLFGNLQGTMGWRNLSCVSVLVQQYRLPKPHSPDLWHQQALPTPTQHQHLHLEYTYKGGPHYHPTCCLLLQLTPFIPLSHTFSSILDQLLQYLGCSWKPMGLGVHENTMRFQ